MIRPMFHETKRYGEYSKPGESVYDHPFQWGSRRIGPDLAREGGKQSHLWHVLHFQDPSQVTPGSIMPEYSWLEKKKLDFASIPLRVKAMRILGVPYTLEDEQTAQEHAREQAKVIASEIVEQQGPQGLEDKEVVALIAYLQRLGTDINKALPTPDTEAQPETTEQQQADPADAGARSDR
jgi:cytochrome c oxidase cbb3-type subunit I/II